MPDGLNLTIAVTRRCNKACAFCYQSRRDQNLAPERLFATLRNVPLGHVSVTGGEPLLHPRLRDILTWLRPRCESLYLLTNGILLHDEWSRFCAETRIKLFVSVPDNVRTTRRRVRRAVAVGADVSVQHVLTDGSVPVLRSLLELRDDVSEVVLLYPVSLREHGTPMAGQAHWNALVREAVTVLAPFGDRLFYEPAFAPATAAGACHPRCGARTVMFMDCDGLFYPCCLLAESGAGSTRPAATLCEPDRCPVLKRRVDCAPNSRRICPLVIRSVDTSAPFSPADIRRGTSSTCGGDFGEAK